ncbi:MAG TPA: thiamine pyrophosphate-dependent dehydrogenase E1 component subunit alpha [Solirubrobacterales bacterium]|nr:thiamine pyrophosphate-dependent dehydrogenase E1 component subunit alpha [Solirubrobacterales bacterium]
MAELSSSQTVPGLDLGAEESLGLYRRMRLIRSFEDAVQVQFQAGNVHGTTHLYSGQEAGAVGVCSVLGEGDKVAGTYRGHGHALALGVSPQGLMDELLGRETGLCGGRAGSMNVVDASTGLIGCFGIVGGSIGAATGAALSQKLLGTGTVAVAFFGEGTANQAYFHECLNWAQVEKLPAVFVCENNMYMEFTPIENVTAGEIVARPIAMGIHTRQVDGNDVWAVREAAWEAVEHARSGRGPAFLETLTYRFVGHSRSDPGRYRRPGELEEWRRRDPLLLARAGLEQRFGIGPARCEEVDAEVAAELEGIVAAGLAAPFPRPSAAATEFKHG